MHFGDRLITSIRKAGHPLCVGFDPHLANIPEIFAKGDMAAHTPETAEACLAFFKAMLDRMDGRVPVIKPQIAFFEQMGSAGIAVLEQLVRRAREEGIVVIMDAKRGDIGSTASAYAVSFFAKNAPMKSDALTINPYLGMDTMEPFVSAAAEMMAGSLFWLKPQTLAPPISKTSRSKTACFIKRLQTEFQKLLASTKAPRRAGPQSVLSPERPIPRKPSIFESACRTV